MINLIRNELTKIFKKKSLYIILIIILGFTVLINCMYKFSGSNRYSYSYSDSYIEHLEQQLKTLNPNNPADINSYIDTKSTLDVANLVKKYGDNSWQATVIQEQQLPSLIYQINEFTYGASKNEENLKKVQTTYNEIIEKLDSDDSMYFIQSELADVQGKIDEQNKLKEETVDKSALNQIEDTLHSLELQKQILNWRIEKNITYEGSYLNEALDKYSSGEQGIRQYENDNDISYEDKLEYQSSLEGAKLNQYAIEHEQDITNQTNARGIMMDIFSEYELLIIVFIVMIAGTIVSEEFNKGTIKLLLVRPYSRIKILLAKLITCFIMLLFVIAIILVMQLLVGGIVFGFDSFSIPAVVYNFTTNQINVMSLISYVGIQLFAKLPLYTLIIAIAFAFSTIFANSALAIVISLAGYMSTSIINALVQAYNIKFMTLFITMNWDWTQYLFGALPGFEGMNLGFSIVMSIMYFIILIIPTFWIFKKKNIKNV